VQDYKSLQPAPHPEVHGQLQTNGVARGSISVAISNSLAFSCSPGYIGPFWHPLNFGSANLTDFTGGK
jgi:hypothetical protein